MKTTFLPVLILVLVSLSACEKSSEAEDEFLSANEEAVEKYIKNFQIIDKYGDNYYYTINYSSGNTVSSITDEDANTFFNYDDSNNLNSVTSDGEMFDINELYQSPYDAFESGYVLEYDTDGNPTNIEVYEDGYDSDVLTGTIIYDPNPNPFFYTLKAAGIIDVLDKVDLNFGYTNPSIVQARQLLPYNNITTMIFKDEFGITTYEVQFDYTYDEDHYPISARVNALSQEETTSYTLLYTYK